MSITDLIKLNMPWWLGFRVKTISDNDNKKMLLASQVVKKTQNNNLGTFTKVEFQSTIRWLVNDKLSSTSLTLFPYLVLKNIY